ncbi:uncharacterized protein B0H64DRAFT_370894 [Chaetomium fimeti]|uniref:Uncharacterized protein n=1 Tax=Chaetomium fimeti TaxID=1854472 RepID=A0AAE0LUW2_9PEZI|nr:hypothetical protein B0H64DRAFT_370894 [Chaetomium fimeti]
MKPMTICLALSAAQLAVCAPIPRHWIEKRDEVLVSGREHNGATPSKAWLIDDNQNGNQGKDTATDGQNPLILPRPKIPQLSLVYPLSRHRIPNGEKQRDAENDLIRLPYQVDAAGPPQPGMPCHQGRPSHDRNNMIIVYLAAAFMVVVVVVEAWGGAFNGQGAIRLDETTGRAPASVRADADDRDNSLDEKHSV